MMTTWEFLSFYLMMERRRRRRGGGSVCHTWWCFWAAAAFSSSSLELIFMTVPCDDHPDVHTSDCWLQHEIFLLLCETKRSHNCCISAVRKPDLFVVLCIYYECRLRVTIQQLNTQEKNCSDAKLHFVALYICDDNKVESNLTWSVVSVSSHIQEIFSQMWVVADQQERLRTGLKLNFTFDADQFGNLLKVV